MILLRFDASSATSILNLKRQSNHEEWDLIADLSFHDLWHDFAHHLNGTPAIQTTVRYTQVSCAHVKEKLKLLKGERSFS